MNAADEVAVLAMQHQLRAAGLFDTPFASHDEAEIAKATGTVDTHRRLLRRWLHALLEKGSLRLEGGRYTGLSEVAGDVIASAWQGVDELEQRAGYGAETLRYVRACSACLGELLRGEVDVRDMLFPQGEFGTAHAAYRDNLVSQNMNRIVIGGIRSIAERRGEPLRVLEVGAGVAGTTTDLAPALAEYTPDYFFTDLSEFFLSEARAQFSEYPWMRYGLFDMNSGNRAQGIAPNSADVILCANVLHNARNAGEVLARLREILAPGGWLVFIEPTRRHNYPLLVSMEFFGELGGFTDLRAETDQTFFTRAQWLNLLTEAGAGTADCVPEAGSPLDFSGQGVFFAQFNTDRVRVTQPQLSAHLAAQVPEYMMPGRIELVDALPRTANGKLDRALLRQWTDSSATERSAAGAVEAPADELEQRIAALWTELLGCGAVGRQQDFYALGGDSLLLSRMVGRLREREAQAAELQWETLLRQMLRDPTVRGLADYLRAAANPEVRPQQFCPLTVLGGGSGSPATVLVHAGTGTLQPYQPLGAQLRDAVAGPLLGLEADMGRYLELPPEALIDRLAADYADHLLGTGSQFQIVGYCLGGLLAAEISRTLSEAGATVDLTVISSYQPPAVHDELMIEYVFACSMGADLAALGLTADADGFGRAIGSILRHTPGQIPESSLAALDGEFASIGTAFASAARLSQEDRIAAIHQAASPSGPYHSGSYTAEEFRHYYRVFRHSMLAVGAHRPDPYAGAITLLRNSDSSSLLPGTRADVAEFWQNLCFGELTVHDIPGDHFGCMSAANAPGLGRLVTGGRR